MLRSKTPQQTRNEMIVERVGDIVRGATQTAGSRLHLRSEEEATAFTRRAARMKQREAASATRRHAKQAARERAVKAKTRGRATTAAGAAAGTRAIARATSESRRDVPRSRRSFPRFLVRMALWGLAARAGVEVVRMVKGRGGAENRSASAELTIDSPVYAVYSYWRDFSLLPTFMDHLEHVEVTGSKTSHWAARSPVGGTVEWDAEIIEDVPGQFISWRSLPGSQVNSTGMVIFRTAPGGRGTDVTVDLKYSVPFGALGESVAALLGESPKQQVHDDLQRFKEVMETGSARTRSGDRVVELSDSIAIDDLR
jgi:uncharacterized membrane protein